MAGLELVLEGEDAVLVAKPLFRWSPCRPKTGPQVWVRCVFDTEACAQPPREPALRRQPPVKSARVHSEAIKINKSGQDVRTGSFPYNPISMELISRSASPLLFIAGYFMAGPFGTGLKTRAAVRLPFLSHPISRAATAICSVPTVSSKAAGAAGVSLHLNQPQTGDVADEGCSPPKADFQPVRSNSCLPKGFPISPKYFLYAQSNSYMPKAISVCPKQSLYTQSIPCKPYTKRYAPPPQKKINNLGMSTKN